MTEEKRMKKIGKKRKQEKDFLAKKPNSGKQTHLIYEQHMIDLSRYLPSGDLEEIYLEYYGEKRITKDEIEVCSALMLLAWIGEKIAGAELFAKYSKTSPFLMEDFHTYFQGGVADMAAWSALVWH